MNIEFGGKTFPAATVNGSLLGPTIHVAVGERLRLSVELSSAIRDLSIHFHGFEMRGQQAYDGVVGITQCAIRPGMNFTYDFVVNEKAGTYWYTQNLISIQPEIIDESSLQSYTSVELMIILLLNTGTTPTAERMLVYGITSSTDL